MEASRAVELENWLVVELFFSIVFLPIPQVLSQYSLGAQPALNCSLLVMVLKKVSPGKIHTKPPLSASCPDSASLTDTLEIKAPESTTP